MILMRNYRKNICLFNRFVNKYLKIEAKYLSSFTERKRFYKIVSITQNDDKYEINLDGRKLKTPNGSLFFTRNQWLALMVANEWQSQREVIRLSSMHLTQLTNTAIDNPTKSCRQTIAEDLINFMDSDTLCFRISEPKELFDLQQKQWNPIIEWFQNKFDCEIPITQTVHLSPISKTTKERLYRHLCSHNRWSLIGLKFATENLKSLILSLALTQRRISVNQSVDFSRLEENYGIEKWGRLESVHDLESHALRTRVSAALLFYFTSSEMRHLSQKGNSSALNLKSSVI